MARPRQFDENHVLDAVVDAFWANGYEATSIRDLAARTGLTQPSLYNAFGDKQALFRRALDHYLDQTMRQRISRIEETLPPGQAITAYFGEVIERSLADKQRRGCLLVNSALEVTADDADLRQAIAGELAQIQGFFQRALRASRTSGEIPDGEPVADAAAHLLTVLLGVRVLARVKPARALMTQAVNSALGPLGLPTIAARAKPRRSS